MILFGLWTADFLRWEGVKAPKWTERFSSLRPNGFFSALLFGIVIALSWTPLPDTDPCQRINPGRIQRKRSPRV